VALQSKKESPFPGLTVSEEAPQADRGITPRCIILGFLAIIPAVFWGVYGDVVSQTDLTSTSLMMPPVLMLALIMLGNAALHKVRPHLALTQAEIITIYVMLTVSVILSGMGMLQFVCTTLGAIVYYKTPENGWGNFPQYVQHRNWVMPKFSAIEGFYRGNQPVPWDAWIRPVLLWSGFLAAMLFSMLCINTIVRKQWMDRERLTFPIAQLPLEMTRPGNRFFHNRLMWMGFFLAAGLESLNSINFLYPSFPKVQLTSFDLAQFFTVAPYNSVGYFPTTFYPLAIGLGFVLSTDVSFSCWFFYLLTKVENISVAALGWTAAGGSVSTPPYLSQQGTGAFVGIAISVVFLARRHLKDVFLKAIGRGENVDDSAEPLSYRTAVLGLLAGFVAMVWGCTFVGVSPLVAVAYILIYFVFALTITRLRAVAGPPWTMGPDTGGVAAIVQPVGSAHFGTQNLVTLGFFNWFMVEMRCCPMPTQIEGMKMAQATRVRQRAMSVVMIAAMVLGIAIGFWACLAVWYKFGAASAKVDTWRTGMGRWQFDRITGYLQAPTQTDTAGNIAMVFGAAVTLILGYIRTRVFWFPFNPAGYVLAHTSMYWLWCPFLVAWICKVTITRYGGIKGYRTALPFFLGLVLGDYVTSSLWALAGSMLGIRMYRCFPC